MKVILRAYSKILLLTIFLIPGLAFAGDDPKIEKKKTYSKSYSVGSNDKVSFDNRFGELRINTWDKNEVKVDITMTAKANTDERAQQILDNITITDDKSGNGVNFKTKIGDDKKNWEKKNKEQHRNEEFSINYLVYMPSRNPLNASNEFGPMIIGDYNGEVEISSKFGTLNAGTLSNVKRLGVEFGEGTIESINNGKVNVSFSDKTLINKISGTLNISLEYCGAVKLVVDNNTKELTIKNNFSNLYLDVNKNLSASFDINTNFGDFSNKSDFSINEKGEDNDDDHGPRFNHQYQGKSGSGNTPVKIKSEFGETVVGHNLEIKTVEKNKNKKKTRSI